MQATDKTIGIAALNRIASLPTPQERVKALISLVPQERLKDARDRMVASGDLVRIVDRHDALRWGERWQRQVEKMESLYELAAIQRDMSEALLKDALAEVERLRKLLA